MLDLLLVNPGGRRRIYQSLADDLTAIETPLWCRIIAGYCRDRGWSVDILDADAWDFDRHEVAGLIEDANPGLVAMVVYGHQPSASTQQMGPAQAAVDAIKEKNLKRRVIMLGGHVAALPQRTLKEGWADYVCNSEGPETVHQLLLYEVNKIAIHEVEGLVWRDDKRNLRWNIAPSLIEDMTQLHGDTWDLLPMDRYRAHNWQCFDGSQRTPYASIYTSLGCPYKCVFCCINAPFHANRYRMRKAENVVAEVDKLVTVYGVTTFKIIDEMFVLNQRHVRAICEGLAAKPYADKLNIWAYARVDTVKDDQPELLRSAGIRWLALGIEAANSNVRDGADKSFSDHDIFRTVRKIQAAGINVIGNFIFGLPEDTYESMEETLKMAKALRCEFANFYSAMAYPGSKLFQQAKPEDLPETWAGYSQHAIDTRPLPTATLTSKEVLAFRDRAFMEYFTDATYLSMIEARFGTGARQQIETMIRQPMIRAA